jgi:hypothetical protein
VKGAINGGSRFAVSSELLVLQLRANTEIKRMKRVFFILIWVETQIMKKKEALFILDQ